MPLAPEWKETGGYRPKKERNEDRSLQERVQRRTRSKESRKKRAARIPLYMISVQRILPTLPCRSRAVNLHRGPCRLGRHGMGVTLTPWLSTLQTRAPGRGGGVRNEEGVRGRARCSSALGFRNTGCLLLARSSYLSRSISMECSACARWGQYRSPTQMCPSVMRPGTSLAQASCSCHHNSPPLPGFP